VFQHALRRIRQSRASRALARQLDYQTRKADGTDPTRTAAWMIRRSAEVRARLNEIQTLSAAPRVLEVGSGAHGLIFYFGDGNCVGLDPLAYPYRSLFPAWQDRVPTLAASGEDLPFRGACFDVVLCDNVIDHAAEPERIVREIARVLRPGGVMYFTVNTHHPIYTAASALHGLWYAMRLPGEVSPFASHTVHLTTGAAKEMLSASGEFDVIEERWDREGARQAARQAPPRHLGDRVKRVFYKNAVWEVLAIRR
jgi:ubiquinone/menaquinone biosynthesis C-methylase UbiE